MCSLAAAVVGTGFIGPVHVEALRRLGVQVRGVVGSTPAKGAAAQRLLGLETEYPTYRDVLRDPRVDVVHLATPNRFHREQCLAAFDAGKHVLCEKPLAMDPGEADQLVRAAGDSGLAAGVAYNVRFYPLCQETAARLRRPDSGDVIHVVGSYVQDWLLHKTDFNWRVLTDQGGALRAVADIGTHWLDLVQFVTGRKVAAVCADLRTVHPVRQMPVGGAQTFSGDDPRDAETESVAINTDDCGSVMLRFDNGANGVLWVSQTTAGKKNEIRFEVATTRQSFCWNSQSPNFLEIGHRDSANEALARDPALLTPRAADTTSYPGGHNEGYPDTFKGLFRAFYSYIEAGDMTAPAPFPTFDDGRHEVLLCEAILDSHRRQRWVEVEQR